MLLRTTPARRFDLARWLARVLCVVFGFVGLLPFVTEAVLAFAPVQEWAAAETRAILKRELGIEATYEARLHLVPLRLELRGLRVASTDGEGPALEVERLRVRPRLFSLLAGRLDLGDIEVDAPRARLVLEDGRIANVAYRLPEQSKRTRPATRSPFGSLSVSEARIAVRSGDVSVALGPFDLDVFAEPGNVFEILLRSTESSLTRARTLTSTGARVVDEDVLCRLELRARLDGKDVLVRRLAATGVADLNPHPGTRPSCTVPEEAPERVELRLWRFHAVMREQGMPYLTGGLSVRAPLALAGRAGVSLPLAGYARFSGEIQHVGRSRIPELRGELEGGGIALEGYRLARTLRADIDVRSDVVRIPRYAMTFADGEVVLEDAEIEPFAPGVPIRVARVDGRGITFPGLMRDLDVTPNTVVRWDLVETHVTNARGTLSPLTIDAELRGETKNFEVFDRAFHDPLRRHMIGVPAAALRGHVGVRPDAILFYDTRADFGQSSLYVELVSVGFKNQLAIRIPPGSRLDLADISPLATLTMKGKAELDVALDGLANDPLLTGNLKVQGLELAGFPLGDVHGAKVTFRPLWVQFSDIQATKGTSNYTVPQAKLDFETRASLLVEAIARSDALDLVDFFEMWHFDEDPRFDAVRGRTAVNAAIRYVLGGPEDRCKGGLLKVAGKLAAHELDLYEEYYDGGEAEFDFLWEDFAAGYRGFSLRVPRMVLKKGSGTLIGRIGVEPGARVSAEVVAASVPIGKLDSLPTMLRAAQGTASAAATASGTLDALEAEVMATITPLRIGSVVLPSSELGVRLEPIRRGSPSGKLTPCGQPVALPFDRAEYDRDPIDGIFRVNGTMFGGQVALEDLRVTRQRKKTASGTIHLRNLDLEPLFALRPDPSGAAPPRGRVSGSVDLQAFAPTNPLAARGTLTLTGLRLERSGYTVELLPGTAPIAFGNRSVSVATAALRVGLPHGQALTLDVAGRVTDLGASPALNAGLRLRRTPLATFAGLVPRLERANGTLSGNLDVSGPLDSPRYSGGFAVERGELALRGLDLPISDIALALRVDGRDVTLVKGSARLGDGTVALRGGARLRGFSVDDARVRVTVQRLSLPAGPGVRAVADAELLAAYRPESNGGRRALPRVTGNVLLRSFEYRRPVTITADLQSLVQRGKRTEFEVYDPSEDAVELDLAIRSERPLKIANELIEAELLLADEGLLLSGTNARYGLRGVVRLRPGGRIVLRRSEFEVTEGTVRFDDPTRIAPEVDVTAVTEYRRYSDVSGTSSPSAAAQSASSAHAATGGRWTIRLHAHGHPDDLRVDLTSDPALPQDDIFLLLTVGLTRAELDQAQSASVGESVALEALGTLTGADRAVKDVVPLIDEFRFGSTYSSRTGRTEPTITIGKRLTERVRGNVTTGLAESREIRSNIEWQLSPRVSVEGSYDNVNDISSSSLGNLGTDVRWRLEFE